MNTDTSFCIGKTHQVCQDYITSFSIKSDDLESHICLLSDGCSSSPNTDIGSRILVHVIKKYLISHGLIDNIFFKIDINQILQDSRRICQEFGILPLCLDATIVYSIYNKFFTEINLCGDGVVAIVLKNDDIIIASCDFPSGYPFYLNYFSPKNERYFNWKELRGKEFPDIEIFLSQLNSNFEEKFFIENTLFNHLLSDDKNIQFLKLENGLNVTFTGDLSLYAKYIVIMSDGVKTFYQNIIEESSLKNEMINHNEIIFDLLQFKNSNGNFMQRRLNKFLKECDKNNIYHSDDISFGATFLGK